MSIESQNYLQAKSYHDLKGLQSLKRNSQTGDDPAALREAAKHFEAFFLQMILKSAREANSHINEDEGLFNSEQVNFYQEMLDEQMSVEVSLKANNGSGLGVADMLTKQLSKKTHQNSAINTLTTHQPNVNHKLDMPKRRVDFTNLTAPDEFKVVGLRQTIKYDKNKSLADSKQILHNGDKLINAANNSKNSRQAIKEDLRTAVNSSKESVFATNKKTQFANPLDFVKNLYPIAQKVAQSFGLDPKILLAQSALETGWGKYVMPSKNGESSFNLFGIKADSRWNGDSTKAATIEFRNGIARTEMADFRSYLSFEESMQDYVRFLQANPRYKKALEHKDKPEIFAGHLQKAGYATDPKYSAKIINIMNMDYLQDLDKLKF